MSIASNHIVLNMIQKMNEQVKVLQVTIIKDVVGEKRNRKSVTIWDVVDVNKYCEVKARSHIIKALDNTTKLI